jgi:ParB family transcriptional regulator, chromosome partitioning protein
MTDSQELVTIRVRSLVISPLNVRQTPSRTIQALAASIKHHGLIEPLVVQDVPGKRKKPGHTEVIDGGRRWRALNVLIDAGDLDPDHRVLCAVYKGDAAHEISAAANMHESMHPADEFDAFRRMIDLGSTIEEVAARFGTTPLTVQRRLKLANVAPTLIQAYRAEALTLDHLMAFAIIDDHKAQEKLWKLVKDRASWERSPERIRCALVKAGSINAAQDKRARFVGLDAYEAAGGAVVRDLFSNGGGFIADEALLQRLAEEKLEAAAEDVRTEGWAWVATPDQWSYSDEAAYGKSQPKKRALTGEESELLVALRDRAAALDKQIDALEAEDETMDAELASLEAQIESIESLQQESRRQRPAPCWSSTMAASSRSSAA